MQDQTTLGAVAPGSVKRPIICAVVSTKGGVGKTTLTANLAGLLANMGQRVLAIDADVQTSLTKYFHTEQFAPHGLTHVMQMGTITPDCITVLKVPRPGYETKRMPKLPPSGCLHLIASDAPNGILQVWLANRNDKGVRLRKALHSPELHSQYDIILIDTQGAVGNLQDAAILAADLLITPVRPDILSAREFIDGTAALIDRLEQGLNITGGGSIAPIQTVIYCTRNTSNNRLIASQIRDAYLTFRGKVSVLETTVPMATAYEEAATAGVPVHFIDPMKAGVTMHSLLWELLPPFAGMTCDYAPQETTGPIPAEGSVAGLAS